ncbi:hypothetical protein [Spirosoma pulveris]
MKNAFSLLLIASLLVACGRSEKKDDTATQSSTTQPAADTAKTTTSKPENCRSVVETDKLGKSDVFQESAKPITVTLTLAQDSSATQTTDGCYFNNTITVLAAKKSGSQVFKRTLLKDDLLYFIKSDDVVERSVLQQVVYKPTFNAQRYITLMMQLIEPVSKKKTDYTVTMNYFGEIIKVR